MAKGAGESAPAPTSPAAGSMSYPTTPLLTVAIPTYKRAQTLRRALDSVVTQLPAEGGVEIRISDNASPDETPAVAAEYGRRYPCIRYSRNEQNRGADFNMYKLVRESSGEYVYMLSDDDVLLPGALARILALVRRHPDVGFFYLNGIGFQLNGQGVPVYFPKPVIWPDQDFVSPDRNAFLGFLKLQLTFVSALLFRRQLWNTDGRGDRFLGTDLYMSFEVVRVMAASEQYMFVAGPLVGVHAEYTAGSYNIFHAFARQWRRLLLIEAVAVGFDHRAMKGVFRASMEPLAERLLAIKRGAVRHDLGWRNLWVIVSSTYDTPGFWRQILPLLLAPAFLLRAVSRGKQILRSGRGTKVNPAP
jgi:abequosyltransferase